MSNLFNLDGKTALVTGCSSGIGQGMALGLAEAGADIIGLSLPGEDAETAEKIAALGRKYSGFGCDFSDRASLYGAIEQIDAAGTPDILINNAGTIMRKPVAEHPDEMWDKVIAINQTSQFILTREFGKKMIERGSGKVLFTCSLLSFQGGINVPGYTASKSAVAGLVRAFANEWAGKGVNVNGIAPGYIATANTKPLREDAERAESILARIPAGRWGEPNDFKGPAVFLCSEASAYVHGAVLFIDGGWMGR